MDPEKQAIEILRAFEGQEPYQLGYSGGKDSDVILHLAKKSGVSFQAVHSHTTVDAPETVRYIRSKPEVKVVYPKLSMWQLIIKHKMPPTRRVRYCCEELKENTGNGKKVISGVRKAESVSRRENHGVASIMRPRMALKNMADGESIVLNKKGGINVLNYDNSEARRMVESCYRTTKTLINPILEWEDEYLWWYIRKEHIELNPLYQEGFYRIGCIGCPMAGKGRWKEFSRYPKYKELYLKAFEKMLAQRNHCGLENVREWSTPQNVFDWWMEDQQMDGQMSMLLDGSDWIGYQEK